jgi:hypothetical protein
MNKNERTAREKVMRGLQAKTGRMKGGVYVVK